MSFTSNLSVAEFALAAGAGLRPLRLVGGEGVFRLRPPARGPGSGGLRPGQTALLTGQASAWNHARDTVLARLRAEAAACGATLVTGVAVRCQVPARRPSPAEPARWYREFTATGTALARRSGQRSPGDEPVLTNLRLPDYVKLTAAGARPAGLVTATAVAAVRSSWEFDTPDPSVQGVSAAEQDRAWKARSRPGDRPEFHAALRQAYAAALDKLRSDATRMGAAGVESITIERGRAEWSPSEWATHIAVFVHAAGTAVTVSSSGPGPAAGLSIMPVRHLNA